MSAQAVEREILDWTEKHRPKTLDELVGNGPAIAEFKAWAESWRDGNVPKDRAVILAGEPGVGKTSAAHALARDMGWGVIELNASDQRNEEVIRRIAGAGAVNRAFAADGSFAQGGGRQLVILDEADNLFGREDRGGLRAIIETIREAKQPLVLVANDLYELQRRGAALKTLARTIKFSKVHSNSIPPAVRRIAQKEGLMLEPGVDKAIAERAGGDLRSAVNDLQALALGRNEIKVSDVEAMGRRDTSGDVWGMLGKVFYGRDIDEARRSTWDLDETPDSLSLWIDENLPVMYKDKVDLVEGYAWLSKADVFLGRVSRKQQYGLWSYATELMTTGVAVSKSERPKGARFQFPTWLRRQSTSKAVRELRDRTAKKIGVALHSSKSRIRQDVFPYLKQMLAGDDEFAAWCAWRFDLEADELAFLLDEKATSARVKKLIEDGRKKHGVPVRETSGGGGSFGRYADTDDDEEPTVSADDDEEEPPAPAPATKKAAAKKAAKPKAATAAKDEETPAAAEPAHADAPPAAGKPQRSLTDF